MKLQMLIWVGLFVGDSFGLDKIETPKGTQPSGLAYHDGHFYVSSYAIEPGIYRIRASDGAVVARLRPGIVSNGRYGGLAPIPQGLIHEAGGGKLALLDYRSGRVIKGMRLPSARYYSDFAVHKNTLFAIEKSGGVPKPDSSTLLAIDLGTGRVKRRFPMPANSAMSQNHGLAYHDGALWMSYDNMILKISAKTGKDLEQFSGPQSTRRLESLASDGDNLWAASFYGDIYRIDLQPVVTQIESQASDVPDSDRAIASDANDSRPLAHFRFDGNAKNEGQGIAEFELYNTEFHGNSLYLNGKYDNRIPPRQGAYLAVCRTPKFDFEAFTVALRFKAESFTSKKSNIIVGGRSYRWFGMNRAASGNLNITLNNQKLNYEVESAPLKEDKWTVVACGLDLPKKKLVAFINGSKAAEFDLPKDFKLHLGDPDSPIFEETVSNWTLTNYSNGKVFHGLVDELIIYNRMLTDKEFSKISLNP